MLKKIPLQRVDTETSILPNHMLLFGLFFNKAKRVKGKKQSPYALLFNNQVLERVARMNEDDEADLKVLEDLLETAASNLDLAIATKDPTMLFLFDEEKKGD